MARFRARSKSSTQAPAAALAVPSERQHTIVERLEGLARAARVTDASRPALMLFGIVLALLALGLVVQASHASTTTTPEIFWGVLRSQVLFRVAAIAALLVGVRIGPQGLRRHIPALTVACGIFLLLVFVPGVGDPRNGAHRWLQIPFLGLSFQPSELARIVMVLWVADRCIRLGEGVRDLRRGALPMLGVGLAFFGAILLETDLGGAILFLCCFLATMWVGGARLKQISGPVLIVGGGAAVSLALFVSYIRHRIDMWLGQASNHQVARTAEAIASGDLFGVGVGQGLWRNARVPYLESDYVLAQVGEELGLFGILLVIGLLVGFTWLAIRLSLSIRDRYSALCAFGLLLSVGLQAMIHAQVVTALAPPKGMPLPFISHGGTALVVSSLAIGLALGAARRDAAKEAADPAWAPIRSSNDPVAQPDAPRATQPEVSPA
jgi:cell division protein FtsW